MSGNEPEEGMLPIFQAQSGFKEYSLLVTGDVLVSFSAWASEEDAEAASEAAASWIAENIADEITLRRRGSARSCSARRSA